MREQNSYFVVVLTNLLITEKVFILLDLLDLLGLTDLQDIAELAAFVVPANPWTGLRHLLENPQLAF